MELSFQMESKTSNNDPFQSDQEEFPEQGESEDTKEVEDSNPKKCSQLQVVFNPYSTSGKLEWAMMDITLAMDPHYKEIQQPPEFLIWQPDVKVLPLPVDAVSVMDLNYTFY